MPTKAYRVVDNWSYTLQESDMVSGNFPTTTTTLNVGTQLADRIKDATVLEPYLATFKAFSTGLLEIVEIVSANSGTGVINMVRAINGINTSVYSPGEKLEIYIPSLLIKQIISGDRILTDGSNVLVGDNGNVLSI